MTPLSAEKTSLKWTSVNRPMLFRVGSATFLLVAAGLLLFSFGYPYWTMHLDAPQYDYRNGLNIIIYVDAMKSKDPVFDELRELNSLNHYIGMRHLDEAAKFERSIAKASVITFSVLLVLAALSVLSHKGWKLAWLIVLPALFFPYIFVADLYYWLRDSGLNLDPTAPFSSSIHPFVPTMLGSGKVGQFATQAQLDSGWYMVVVASVLILVALGLWFYQLYQGRKEAQTHA